MANIFDLLMGNEEQEELPAIPLRADYVPEAAPKPLNPVVSDYLMKKSGRAPAAESTAAVQAPAEPSEYDKYKSQFGDEAYKKAQGDAEERKSGLGWAQFAAGIGDAMAGRSPSESAKTFQGIRANIDDQTTGAFEKRKAAAAGDVATRKAMQGGDPNSQASVTYRKMMEAKFPDVVKTYGDDWKNVSVDDKDNIFQPLKLREDIEARKESARLLGGQRQDALNLKREEKLEKKKTLLNEVEDRRQNILDNLGTLDSMVGENGTWEVLGSHNQDMDRLVEQIATDMAKLQDPNSVARPSEVEAVKKNLIRSGFQNSNSTAKDIIANFKGEVEKRANTAYKVRGIELPKGMREGPEMNQDAEASAQRQSRIAELRAKAGK